MKDFTYKKFRACVGCGTEIPSTGGKLRCYTCTDIRYAELQNARNKKKRQRLKEARGAKA